MDKDPKQQAGEPDAPQAAEGTPEPATAAAAPADDDELAWPESQAPKGDEPDPELMQLPEPRRRRRRRHPLISVLVIALSAYLMWFVRDDLLYFFQPRKAVDLGDVSAAVKQGTLRHNTHVALAGAPDRKHALIVEARFGGYDSFFRLLQTSNRVFVQQHREGRISDESPSGGYSGRLVRFAALPYQKGLASYFARTMTVPHELDFAAVAAAKGAGSATLKDRDGAPVPVTPDTMVWVNVAFPDEWILQLSKRDYPKIEDTGRLLAELTVPGAVDEEASSTFWRFVLRVPPDQVPALMTRLKAPDLHAALQRRQVSYSVRWNQLTAEGRELVLSAADPTAPARYRVEPGEEGKSKLVPVRETVTRVPAEGVLFITTSTPLVIPPDAFVLVVGKAPVEGWYYVVLYLLLATFIILNALALVQRLRARSAAAQA